MILDSGFTGSIAIQGRLAGDGILREAESEDRPRVWERENTGRRRNIVTAMGSIRLVYDDEGDIPDVDFRWKRIICSVGD
jgi:hypothetical protein